MNQKRTKAGANRRTARQVGNYDIVHYRDKNAPTASILIPDQITTDLAEYKELSSTYPPNKRTLFLEDGITQRVEGEEFFERYPTWYVDHVMAAFEDEAEIGRQENLMRHLLDDPVGVKPDDTTDEVCWKRNSGYDSDDPTSKSHKKTSYKRDLEAYQLRMYKHMRASLVLFMDDNAANKLTTWISTRESALPEDKRKRRLEKSIRIPWKTIQDFVLDNVCTVTLGSFHYKPLLRLKREDNQLFLPWTHAVRKITEKVKAYGRGWEAIIDKEAMYILKDWLTDREITALTAYLVKKKLQDEYPTITNMANNLSVEEFIQVFQDITAKELPNKFTQSMQKAALQNTLLSYDEHTRVVKEYKDKLEALRKEKHTIHAKFIRLQDKVNKNSKRDRETGSTLPQAKQRKKEADRKDKPDPKHEPGPDEYPNVSINKTYGKAKPGCCQRCHNVGLKNRKHKGRCDPSQRQKAVERLKNKKKRRQENHDKNNRKHPLSSYPLEACEHCVREDVPPKYSTGHSPDACYRKPGGILDQKKIFGLANRLKEVLRLIKQKQQKNEEEHGSSRVATSRVSVAMLRSDEPSEEAKAVSIQKPRPKIRITPAQAADDAKQ